MVVAKLFEIIAKTVAALVIMAFNLIIFGWGIVGFAYVISPTIKIKLSDIYGILALMLVFLLISSACILFILSAFLNRMSLSRARTVLFNLLWVFTGLYLLAVTWSGFSEKRLAAGMDAIIFTSILGLGCLAWAVFKSYRLWVQIRMDHKVHGQLVPQVSSTQSWVKPLR